MNIKIKEIAKLINDKIETDELTNSNYISTENMLQNFGGITTATNVPSGKCTNFNKNDILLSNIRPYFKKTWFATFSGGCSNDVVVIRANENICLNKYLFYILNTNDFVNTYVASCKGTKMPRGNKDVLLDWEIDLPNIKVQQHIINTIGSVDDLIENKQIQIDKIMYLGCTKINEYNLSNTKLMSEIATFEKGQELGSANYIEYKTDNVLPYLRVGDLLDNSNCVYVEDGLAEVNTNEDDVIVAFDGAPGRNAICLSGIRSSGLYRIVCNSLDKGLLFFEINSNLNQSIIKNHSQGTTILHASKAIKYLEYADVDETCKDELSTLFNQLVIIKKQVNRLKKQKQLLLDKYFTNL